MGKPILNARTRLLALIGILAATVAIAGAGVMATGASSALAAPGMPTASTAPTRGQGQQANFYAKLATNLGISQDTLAAAVKQTDLQQIDAALAAGTLTADQAQAARDRINNNPSGLPPFGGAGGHHGPGGPGGRGERQPSGSPAPSAPPASH